MLRLAAELLASVGCVFGLGDMARSLSKYGIMILVRFR